MTAPKTATPAAPRLSARCRHLRRQLAGHEVNGAGPLALLDQALSALDRAEAAAALLADEGLVVITERTGAAHAHPAVAIEAQARAAFLTIWRTLGLDKSSRRW